MRLSVFIVLAMAFIALSVAVQADEHVCVLSGQRGDATLVYGGPKVRFDGSLGTWAFLQSTPPVDAAALARWLQLAYVERDQYAGFLNCPVDCYSTTVRPCSAPASCASASATSGGGEFPAIESTYWGVRTAIAAGGFFDCFWYDKFAAYARSRLADPSAPIEDLTAACRLLEIVTGLNDADRTAVGRQVSERACAMGSEAYRLAPLLNAASVTPSPTLQVILRERATFLALTLQEPRMETLLELAHLQHLLGGDSPVAPGAIADGIATLYAGDGLWSRYSGARTDLLSALAALEALDLLGELAHVDPDSVRQGVLACWISPGFAAFDPSVIASAGPDCTDLHLTYAGTECLAILENLGVPAVTNQ